MALIYEGQFARDWKFVTQLQVPARVCVAIRLECYVSMRLIRKLKTLPVRAPPRFSISITVLLRDNFHIRDGYIARAPRPFQLQSVCSCSFARSCARLHTRTCRNSRDRIYGAIRFDSGRLIDPISVCSSFVYWLRFNHGIRASFAIESAKRSEITEKKEQRQRGLSERCILQYGEHSDLIFDNIEIGFFFSGKGAPFSLSRKIRDFITVENVSDKQCWKIHSAASVIHTYVYSFCTYGMYRAECNYVT